MDSSFSNREREDKTFKKAICLLRKITSKDNFKLAEMWFSEKQRLAEKLHSKIPNYAQSLDLVLRWHTRLGMDCNENLRGFLIRKLKDHNRATNESIRKHGIDSAINVPFAIIDLNGFVFAHNGKNYSLAEFADSFVTSRIGGLHDLRGVNLSGISLSNCIITNCFFADADLSCANLFQMEFRNCLFTKAIFNRSSLVGIRYDDNTSFSEVSLAHTFLNGFDLNGFSRPRNIAKPTYGRLLYDYFFSLWIGNSKKTPIHSNDKNTVFLGMTTEKMNAKSDIEFVSYVDWFQYLGNKIYNAKLLTLKEQIGIFLSLITTKYWSSWPALISFSILLNVIYSGLYLLMRNSFKNIHGIVDCFYFSIVTFTTLGFGDITPQLWPAKLLVITEVVFGYTVLALLVFLLSKRISKIF